jgi:NAD+ kinase
VKLVLGDSGYGYPPGDEPKAPVRGMGGVCDVVVVLGGDGTILRAAPQVAPAGIPLVAVNTGSFGFLATAEAEEAEALLDELLAGDLREERRALLRARSPACGIDSLALNDVALHRVEAARVAGFETKVGNTMMSRLSGDGICVSTPTGSTAYSLSAGGPVLHPSVEAFAITPLCAHTLAMRATVVSDKEKITLRVLSKDADAHVLVDGQVMGVLTAGQEVLVEKGECEVRLLQRKGRSFYQVLRDKLGWAGPDQGNRL